MQTPGRYGLARRILFPYSGEEPLSRKQGLRVILTWALLFPLTMSICALAMSLSISVSVSRIGGILLFAFLSGICIFGGLGWLIVSMNNRAARFRQQRKGNIRGGSYGS